MIIFNHFCSICHIDGNASGTQTYFQYQLSDGRITDAPNEVGRCHGCKGLCAIETLDREYWANQIRTVGREIASITIKHRLLRQCVVRLSKRPAAPP